MEALQATFKGMLTSDKQQGMWMLGHEHKLNAHTHAFINLFVSLVSDMTRFYFLLSRVADGLTNSAKTFEDHVAELGAAIVKEQASMKSAQAAMKSSITFIQQVQLRLAS
jgi:hypothetical protein